MNDEKLTNLINRIKNLEALTERMQLQVKTLKEIPDLFYTALNDIKKLDNEISNDKKTINVLLSSLRNNYQY